MPDVGRKEESPMKNRTTATVQMVTAAMFAALTLLSTSVLKIQTPTFGYIHLGDGLVLLSGIFLGPVYGGLAAGLGSALSDLLGGYAVWVPGTFVIKYLTAAAAAALYRILSSRFAKKSSVSVPALLLGGIAGEAIMTIGYFLYNILIIVFSAGALTRAGMASAVTLSLTEIPFNLTQGFTGILLAVLLAPVLSRVRLLSSPPSSESGPSPEPSARQGGGHRLPE